MTNNRKIQVLHVGNGYWGIFVDGVLVRTFDNKGQAWGFACDPNF